MQVSVALMLAYLCVSARKSAKDFVFFYDLVITLCCPLVRVVISFPQVNSLAGKGQMITNLYDEWTISWQLLLRSNVT